MRGFIVPAASAVMARWFGGTAIGATPTVAIGALGGAFATEVSRCLQAMERIFASFKEDRGSDHDSGFL